MIVFGIRQKSTGFWLPRHTGRAGGSWVEPAEGALPRLFSERRYAKGFLTVWMRGGVTVKHYRTYEGDYDEDWNVTPQPHRAPSDMEIVEIELRPLDSKQSVS